MNDEHMLQSDPADGLILTKHMLESILLIDRDVLRKEGVTVDQLLDEILPVIEGSHHNIVQILHFFSMIEEELVESGELPTTNINHKIQTH